VPTLVALFQRAGSLATQTTAATALGYVGDRRAIAPLLAALGDRGRTERARGYAAVALGNVADVELLPWNARIALGLHYRASTSTLTDPVYGGGILDIF
jgi:HEAT repeat protein